MEGNPEGVVALPLMESAPVGPAPHSEYSHPVPHSDYSHPAPHSDYSHPASHSDHSNQPTVEGSVDDEAFLYGRNGGNQNAPHVRLGKHGPSELPNLEEVPQEDQYFVVDSTPQYVTGVGFHGEGQAAERQSHGTSGPPKKKKKKTMMTLNPEVEERLKDISSEQVMAENKQRIMVVDNLATGHFLCTICNVPVNCIKNLETHMRSLDHVRKTKMLLYAKTNKANNISFSCDLCSVSCPNGSVYEQHISGKKHAKMLETKALHGNNAKLWPISENLDILFKEEVVKEGTGHTLGVTPTMMSLLKLEGPFIGLQYAQEIGTEDENCVPSYFCTLCDILSEAFNLHLHYASSFHRTNVMKKDYPQEYEILKPHLSDQNLSRGQVNAKVKELAQAIEAREGRNVEVIQRKIVVRPNIKGIGEKKANKNPSKGGTSARGRGGGPSGRGRGGPVSRGGGNKPGRGGVGHQGGRGRGSQPGQGSQRKNIQLGQDSANAVPIGQVYGGAAVIAQQSASTPTRGQKKKRRGSRGGGNPNDTTASVPRYGPQGVSTSYGGYGEDFMSPSTSGGSSWREEHLPLVRGKGGRGRVKRGRGRDDYGLRSEPSSFHAFNQGSYSSLETSSFMSVPSEPPPNMANVAHLMTMEKLKSESGDKTEAYKKLALQMIKTEEDAEQAFQLSSALTQALLEYRMKSVSSLMPDASPISSLLNLLQKPQS